MLVGSSEGEGSAHRQDRPKGQKSRHVTAFLGRRRGQIFSSSEKIWAWNTRNGLFVISPEFSLNYYGFKTIISSRGYVIRGLTMMLFSTYIVFETQKPRRTGA
jgi:hypothetical protein